MANTGIILEYADERQEPLVQPSLSNYSLSSGDTLYVFEDGLAERIEVSAGSFLQARGGVSRDIQIQTGVSDGLMKVYGGAVAENVTSLGTAMVLSGGTATGMNLKGNGYMTSTGGLLSDVDLQDSSRFNVIGGTLNGCVLNAGCSGILDGGVSTRDITVHSGASLVIGSDVIFTGMVSLGGTLVQNSSSTATSATANFLLTELNPSGNALLDWSKCPFGNLQMTVAIDQATGTYALANAASLFSASVSLHCDSLESIYMPSSGIATYHNRVYTLGLTGDNDMLALNVSDYQTTASADALSWGAINGAASYVLEMGDVQLEVASRGVDLLGLAKGDYTWRVRNTAEADNWQTGQAFSQTSAPEEPQKLEAATNGAADMFFAHADGVWDSGYMAQHVGNKGTWTGTGERVELGGKARITDIFAGSEDASVLKLALQAQDEVPEVQASGVALFLDDIYSASPVPEAQALSCPVPEAQASGRLSQINTILATDGADIIDLTSQRFDFAGGVTVHGGAGDDVIWANSGENMLVGGDGNDRIIGGSGDDIIIGGTGNDTLHGGGGNDIFCFGEAWGQDSVSQLSNWKVALWFSGSQDELQLSFVQEGSDTLITASTGDSIRTVGMSVSLADCRFNVAAANETEFNRLATAGAFA